MINKKISAFRKKLKKKCLIGAWFQLPIYEIGNIIKDTFDWCCIDLEHGLINVSDISYMQNSLINKNFPILVRLNIKDIKLAPKILDLGIDGLIIANTNNKNDLKDVVKYSLYPPKGERSIGYAKSNNFHFKQNDLKFSPILIPMIEKKEAFENLNTLLDFRNFDGFFIGPVDLSASYNKFKLGETKLIENKIKKIVTTMKKNNIPVGIHSISPDKSKIKKLKKSNYNFIAYSTDSVIIKHFYT